MLLLLGLIQHLYGEEKERLPYHDDEVCGTTIKWDRIMNSRNPRRFFKVCRMEKPAFIIFLDKLLAGGLIDRPGVPAAKKLMMFIHLLKGNTVECTAEMFQCSTSTVSVSFHEILDIMMTFRSTLYVKPDISKVPAAIANSPNYFSPYFDNCIGAIDGSHIPAWTTNEVYRNRKGFISQNVLFAVNFDLTIQYCLSGWEGSAHDGSVLEDAIRSGELVIPQGKYYLGDAGYGLTRQVLVPFRGTRYHLQEWAKSRLRPENEKELFNKRHASLRNAVERTFGVMKKRFAILDSMHAYTLTTQSKIVHACSLLHNHIRLHTLTGGGDRYFQEEEKRHDSTVLQPDPSWSPSDDEEAEDSEDEDVPGSGAQLRAGIAQAMWRKYEEVRSVRRRLH
jgi:hypothetical protein